MICILIVTAPITAVKFQSFYFVSGLEFSGMSPAEQDILRNSTMCSKFAQNGENAAQNRKKVVHQDFRAALQLGTGHVYFRLWPVPDYAKKIN